MRELGSSLRLTAILFLFFGVAYSLVIVGVGNVLFPFQAGGSILRLHGKIIGSALIGQEVTAPDLFHGRPSATVNPSTAQPEPYAADNSGGSNLGPTNRALLAEIRRNIIAIRPMTGNRPIPSNLVESSASGLDPDITVQDALVEAPAVARRTGIPLRELTALIHRLTVGRLFGLYGPPRVNVLQLNLHVLALYGRRR